MKGLNMENIVNVIHPGRPYFSHTISSTTMEINPY
jgi:hypothetical protein